MTSTEDHAADGAITIRVPGPDAGWLPRRLCKHFLLDEQGLARLDRKGNERTRIRWSELLEVRADGTAVAHEATIRVPGCCSTYAPIREALAAREASARERLAAGQIDVRMARPATGSRCCRWTGRLFTLALMAAPSAAAVAYLGQARLGEILAETGRYLTGAEVTAPLDAVTGLLGVPIALAYPVIALLLFGKGLLVRRRPIKAASLDAETLTVERHDGWHARIKLDDVTRLVTHPRGLRVESERETIELDAGLPRHDLLAEQLRARLAARGVTPAETRKGRLSIWALGRWAVAGGALAVWVLAAIDLYGKAGAGS